MDGFDCLSLLMFAALGAMATFLSILAISSGEPLGILFGLFIGLTGGGGAAIMCITIISKDRRP